MRSEPGQRRGLPPEQRVFLERSLEVCPWPWWPGAVAAVAARMQTDGAHDFAHLLRVLGCARAIAAAELQGPGELEARWPVLAAAVLLHDVVNLPKDHPERAMASRRSSELAGQILEELGALDEPGRRRAAQAVAAHSFSSGLQPELVEGQILCDADRLECIGAIGIARTFYVAGMLGRGISHPDDVCNHGAARALDDTRWSLDHFQIKLLTLRQGLHTEAARRMAEARHERIVAFLEAFDVEVAEALRAL